MTGKKYPKSDFWKIFIVTGAIPAFLLLTCWNIFSQHTFEEQKRKLLSAGRREIREIRREGVNNVYFQRKLNRVYSEISEAGFKKEKLAQVLKDWKNGPLKFISLKFYDAEGKQLKFSEKDSRDRVVSEKIYQALINAEAYGNERFLSQNRTFFESFAGGVVVQEIVREKSVLLKVMRNGTPAYFYWNSFYDHGGSGNLLGGMLATFSSSDIPEFAGIKLMAAEKNAESEWKFGVVSTDQASSISMKIASMQKNFNYEIEENSKFMIIEPFENRLVIFGTAANENLWLKIADIFLKIMAMFLVFASIRLSFDISSENFEISEERKRKIGLSICLSPLVFLVVVGYFYVDVKSQLYAGNARESLEAMVETVDESYEIAVKKLESLYDKVRGHQYVADMKKEKLQSLVTYLVDRDAFQRVFVVNPDGEILFGWPFQKSDADFVKRLVPAVARRIFSMHLGIEPNLKNRLNDMMVDKMTDGFSEILGDLKAGLYNNFENLNRINEIWLGNNRYYVYAGFVESQAVGKPDLILIWHKTNTFARRYLTRQVRRNLADGRSGSIKLAMMPRRMNETPIPPEFTKYSFSRYLSERVNKTGTRQFSIEEKDGEKWLVLAHPMKSVPDSILFAMYPVSEIKKEINLMIIQFFLIFACTATVVWQAIKIVI